VIYLSLPITANKVSKKFGRRTPEVSSEVMDKLMNHDWPGNVRELENVIERAVALSSDRSILTFGASLK